MHINPMLKEIASFFTARDREICLVGGAVRDMLLGKKAHDWDLASNAFPEEVFEIFRKNKLGKVIPTGIKHGTVTVLYKGHNMEITTYRAETAYTDGRRPDNVQYISSIQDDLSRRDFTMNAIALRLPGGDKIDPFGGEADLKAKLIRCVGNPSARFSEDGLRPMRAVRFAAQLSFNVETKTLSAIPGALDKLAGVSAERIRDETEKIILSDKPSRGLLLMEQTGILKLILPELAACRGVDQNVYHDFDVLDHCLLACDYAAEKNYSLEVRLAALFHDTGKTVMRNLKDGTWTFYKHEMESEKIARRTLSRFKFPNTVIHSVCHLVKEHMFHYTDDWTDGAVRRFLIRIGEANITAFYQLRRADAFAKSASEPALDFLLPLVRRVEKVLAENHAFSLKDLAVSGKDLLTIGIQPGKSMGLILNLLLETVLDDPGVNTRQNLLRIARNLHEKISAEMHK